MNFQVINSSIDRDALLICVEGELDLSTAPRLQRDAEAAMDGYRSVVLDLSKCPFIDSTGLRLVLHLHRELADGNGASAPMVVVTNPAIRQFFSLTAIDQSVPVFLSVEQALQSVRSSRSGASSSYGEASHPTAVSAEG